MHGTGWLACQPGRSNSMRRDLQCAAYRKVSPRVSGRRYAITDEWFVGMAVEQYAFPGQINPRQIVLFVFVTGEARRRKVARKRVLLVLPVDLKRRYRAVNPAHHQLLTKFALVRAAGKTVEVQLSLSVGVIAGFGHRAVPWRGACAGAEQQGGDEHD